LDPYFERSGFGSRILPFHGVGQIFLGE